MHIEHFNNIKNIMKKLTIKIVQTMDVEEGDFVFVIPMYNEIHHKMADPSKELFLLSKSVDMKN